MDERARWARLVRAALDSVEREQFGSPCPVVDHEVTIPAMGEEDEIHVWLVCRTPAERRQFLDGGLARFSATLRERLLASGYPEVALVSLSMQVTSRTELEAQGGRFAGLR